MFVSEDYNGSAKFDLSIDLSGFESTSRGARSTACFGDFRFWREETMRNYLLGTTTWKHLERKKKKNNMFWNK